jgi:hypothetical protein
MKQIKIHYQDNREFIENSIYYPEDNKTPKQRVEFVKNLKLEDTTILVSACPYIIQAFVKYFKESDIECFVNNVSIGKDINKIFTEFANPMKDLVFNKL